VYCDSLPVHCVAADCLAHADRGLNEHRAKVREALIYLLMETVSDSKHQEVLRRVFGPDTKFDTPILNFKFDNPNLARLVTFGIQNVVWETPACSQGQARSVLKPIKSPDQEPLLELLGMFLYIVGVLISAH
jgi:hypothetical protein